MTPFEVFQSLQTQEQALDYLEQVRWKGRPVCPYCGSEAVGRHASGDRASHRWQCRTCTRTFSVIINTIFQGSHVPLRNLLMILALAMTSHPSPSAYKISNDLNIRRPTVSNFMRKIRNALSNNAKEADLLTSIIDFSYNRGIKKKEAS